jgi:hypothetical protein
MNSGTNLTKLGIKVISMTALTYKTKDGKIKRITAKQEPELFVKLNAIIKKAEKEGNLWNCPQL